MLAAINLFLVAATAFTATPCIQTRILDKAREAPSLASAGVQSAFNLANSLGASLGGLAIAAGFGLTAPDAVGALLAVAGLALVVLSARTDRRAQSRAVAPAGA